VTGSSHDQICTNTITTFLFYQAQPDKVTGLLFSESIYNISAVPNLLTTMIWKNGWVLFVGYEQTGYYCLFFSLLKSSRCLINKREQLKYVLYNDEPLYSVGS
jgi:hypothetical protein